MKGGGWEMKGGAWEMKGGGWEMKGGGWEMKHVSAHYLNTAEAVQMTNYEEMVLSRLARHNGYRVGPCPNDLDGSEQDG
eukprot:5365794-Pleurochrysis_carterae.AAC.1